MEILRLNPMPHRNAVESREPNRAVYEEESSVRRSSWRKGVIIGLAWLDEGKTKKG
jgi:hypothetical protein